MDFSPLSHIAGASPLKRKKNGWNLDHLFQEKVRWSFLVLVFLLPVFFLPWTVDAFEVNKQTLLIIVTFVALLAWLGSMVLEKRFSFRSGWVNLFPALFLGSVFVSSLLSHSGYQTWIGQASQEYTSFLTTAVLVFVFYILLNTAADISTQRRLFFSLLLSGSVSLLLAFSAISPFSFLQLSRGFNTVGTINTFVAFLSVLSSLGIGLWLISRKDRTDLLFVGTVGVIERICIVFVSISTLFFLMVVDFWALWVVMILGMLLLLAFAFLQSDVFGKSNRFVLPFSILLISVLFLFLPSPLKLKLPLVVSPSYATSSGIVREVWSEHPIRLTFGSGPGTFVDDYTKYKPQGVNQTMFWNVRFDRAKSHVMTMAATFGVVGTLAWILVVLFVGIKALSQLLKERGQTEEWKATYVLFVAWVPLVLSLVLYSSNMTLQFLFWTLSGLLAARGVVRLREADFSKSPKWGLACSFGFVLVLVAVVATLFVTGQRYVSEVAFAQAVRLDRQQAPTEQILEKLRQSVASNGWSDIYYRNLNSALFLYTRNVLQQSRGADGQILPEKASQIQQLINTSLNASKRAVALAPYNVLNWAVLAGTYRDVIGLVKGAEDLSAAAYEKALELEPMNPALQTNLGRLHLMVADYARAFKTSENKEVAANAVKSEQTELAAAEEIFNKAIDLKADYAPAHYYLAGVFERQGRLEDATNRLVALRNYNPMDVGLGFQLSMLYIRLEKYDLAQTELERIIKIAPTYSNARWFLASVYEIDGNLKSALEQVQKVAELNPDNILVKARVEKLKSGQLTTKIPNPVEEGDITITDVQGEQVVSEGDQIGTPEVPSEEDTIVDHE